MAEPKRRFKSCGDVHQSDSRADGISERVVGLVSTWKPGALSSGGVQSGGKRLAKPRPRELLAGPDERARV